MKYVVPIHQRQDFYLDKLIQQKFSSFLMSDSKWVKLLATLVANAAIIRECLVKPIWEEQEPTRHLLFDENTYYDFDYYASAMESMVSGNPRGWYAYKEIEWLDFPRFITTKGKAEPVSQDLEAIELLLSKVGQFQLELTEENLRLYAYLK
ncbi:hypothetical protein GKZ68_06615 [Hymenobacter sp. BRD128]|uniref:hypothetical protein n=1 Tax=Hymenobacter sp. BRD128 TaxID=2675878 RepID=UPI0015633C57|nr:hypothetical protein [Hymenobacter sp. BRD128]QKG56338.1 hypothetical protein GKZ68_06615 [Hymenobacter sp. BRD128]